MIEQVFEVFGDKLPERHVYSATKAKPFSVLQIVKQYRSWKAFEYEYNKFAQGKRAEKVTKKEPKIVTKAV